MATTLTANAPGRTRLTMPPRATFTRLKLGTALGRPLDREQQRRVLMATLALLARDAPVEPAILDERPER